MEAECFHATAVSEKQAYVERLTLQKICGAAEAQQGAITRLSDALAFYADADNWIAFPPDCDGPASQEINSDHGDIARTALEPKP